jgi:hypothetical protein
LVLQSAAGIVCLALQSCPVLAEQAPLTTPWCAEKAAAVCCCCCQLPGPGCSSGTAESFLLLLLVLLLLLLLFLVILHWVTAFKLILPGQLFNARI